MKKLAEAYSKLENPGHDEFEQTLRATAEGLKNGHVFFPGRAKKEGWSSIRELQPSAFDRTVS